MAHRLLINRNRRSLLVAQTRAICGSAAFPLKFRRGRGPQEQRSALHCFAAAFEARRKAADLHKTQVCATWSSPRASRSSARGNMLYRIGFFLVVYDRMRPYTVNVKGFRAGIFVILRWARMGSMDSIRYGFRVAVHRPQRPTAKKGARHGYRYLPEPRNPDPEHLTPEVWHAKPIHTSGPPWDRLWLPGGRECNWREGPLLSEAGRLRQVSAGPWASRRKADWIRIA